MTDTANAPERKVFDEWFQDTFKDPDGSLEHLPKWFLEDAWFIWKASATHCDELVAAAYLDTAETIRQLPELMPMNAAQVRAVEYVGNYLTISRIPANARAALTAYGERMKAEGAREAQEKIARLTEAAKKLTASIVALGDGHLVICNGDRRTGEGCTCGMTASLAALQENADG